MIKVSRLLLLEGYCCDRGPGTAPKLETRTGNIRMHNETCPFAQDAKSPSAAAQVKCEVSPRSKTQACEDAPVLDETNAFSSSA